MGIPSFYQIISPDSLLRAWQDFVRGKRSKFDVQKFERDLMDQVLLLHEELRVGTYRHGPYYQFHIHDPKPRHISKATVRDRLVHHAVHQALYPFYDRRFVADSFSCRLGKGVHAGGLRFRKFAMQASRNTTRTCWVLKCDVSKFFASIDHRVLLSILRREIEDARTVDLLEGIVGSFEVVPGKGLPLGNLTSQLFANVYMNELDQFVKHQLRQQWYVRYADDFVFLHPSRDHLASVLAQVSEFLSERLALLLHPKKVSLKTFSSGIDFLGWVHFPTHRVLRSKTRNRIERRIHVSPERATIQSYLGLLRHGNTFGIARQCASIEELYRV